MSGKSKPGDSSFKGINQTAVTDATNVDNATQLTPGAVYTARVIARQEDGTYEVEVEDPTKPLDNVLLATPIVGGLLGFNVRVNVAPGTRVKLAYGTPSFIYAVIPENASDWLNARNRSMIWGDVADDEVGISDLFSDHAEDLHEGEVEIGNLYGVSLDMLTALMRMRAGDRAAVECHLINDMVRIISGQWRHISGLGDDLIFDHGRPTMERSWSSYRHEVVGKVLENEPFATMDGDEVDREELDEERLLGMGRYRFREFLGFAGDFIHSFVTDPPETAVQLAKGAAPGAGKSWIHRNSDGTVIIQSVADIRFERVCRIPVPVRVASHEDPTVTENRAYRDLADAYLKLPSVISPTEPKDAFQMAYHIRSYARWISRYHSFARMLQLGDEYEIAKESLSPAPEWTNRESDREDQNARVDYYDSYSCITQLRDGSIVIHDGYGSSIVTSNGNVQISASRHIDLEAAGDIRMVGNNIMLKAKRNIELSATVGGLILHGYAWLKMLCEKGSLWLRSNAVTDKATAPQAKEDGAPVPEVAGWESGAADGHAVLVEAAEGASAYRSQKGVTIAVDGSTSDDADSSYDIKISTQADLDLFGRRLALLHSQEKAAIGGVQTVAIVAPNLVSSASNMFIGPNRNEPFMSMQGGTLWCRSMSAFNFDCNLIRTEERSSGPRPISPDPAPDQPLKPHYGHVGVLRNNDKVEAPDPPRDTIIEAMETAREAAGKKPTLAWSNSLDGPKWGFPAHSEYAWDSRERSKGGVPETITQQHLRLDDSTTGAGATDRWDGPGYEDWTLENSLSGARLSSRGGFGSHESLYRADDSGESLHEPSDKTPLQTVEFQTSWRPAAQFQIKILKRA